MAHSHGRVLRSNCRSRRTYRFRPAADEQPRLPVDLPEAIGRFKSRFGTELTFAARTPLAPKTQLCSLTVSSPRLTTRVVSATAGALGGALLPIPHDRPDGRWASDMQ